MPDYSCNYNYGTTGSSSCGAHNSEDDDQENPYNMYTPILNKTPTIKRPGRRSAQYDVTYKSNIDKHPDGEAHVDGNSDNKSKANHDYNERSANHCYINDKDEDYDDNGNDNDNGNGNGNGTVTGNPKSIISGVDDGLHQNASNYGNPSLMKAFDKKAKGYLNALHRSFSTSAMEK